MPARNAKYQPRIIDHILADRLESAGAVLIDGPKACGKTYTAEQACKSFVYLDVNSAQRTALAIDPGLVLQGEPPQLVDEWQLEATPVWNYVRDQVNRRGLAGQYVLTGSAVPDDDVSRHSGAGRFARLRMRPMSLFESGESSGQMSLAALLNGERPTSSTSALTVSDIVELVIRGGWPMNLTMSPTAAARANRDYLTNMAEVDLQRVDAARNDPRRAQRLLKALARNTALEHKVARLTVEADGKAGDLSRATAYDYLSAFDRLLITDNVPAFSTHLRSRATLRNAERTHFVDPSLAVAALGADHKSLLADLEAFGFLFESMAVRDVRAYSQPLDGQIFHYRDSDDLEIDIIVTTPSAWGAFEVKLGTNQIDDAAESLKTFAEKVDTTHIGEPAVLGVITGIGLGYTRADGVVVAPIGSLGP